MSPAWQSGASRFSVRLSSRGRMGWVAADRSVSTSDWGPSGVVPELSWFLGGLMRRVIWRILDRSVIRRH
jgi:hypothetical protein